MTEKQKRFADEYLIDLNATRAYRAVYTSVKSDEVARANGSRLLSNANVSAYVLGRMKDRQERVEISQDRVLQELAAIAFTNATDIVSVRNGETYVKDTDELTETQKKAIASIKMTKHGAIEIKMNDKRAALELLGRHLGSWNDKLEVSGIQAEQSKLEDMIQQMRGG